MFERFRAAHPILRGMSFGPVTQAAITAGTLVAAAFWVANLDDGGDPRDVTAAGGDSAPLVRRAPEPQISPVVELPLQDTIFIVGTDAEAHSLRVLLVEDAAIRNALALAPTQDEVLVATTDEEAELLVATLKDGNQVLAALARPEVRVVNLRTP